MGDVRPIGEGWRPLGAIEVSAGGTVASGHEATGRNLYERGVVLKNSVLENPPVLKECHDAFWEALFSGTTNPKVPYEKYSEMANALKKSYPKGNGTNEGETAFDEKLFEEFRNYLGEMVADVITKKRADGTTSLATIVLKGEWVFEGATYAMGFSRQVTSAQLGIPKEYGCAQSSRHDHSCVLLAKKRADGVFSVIETSANIELKTKPKSCRLEEVVVNRRKLMKPDLLGKDGALAQSIAYTLSEVWTCLARQGMKNDTAKSPSRVPFGIVACRLTDSKKQPEQKSTTAKKMRQTVVETRWALGSLTIPDACGGRFAYQIKSFGSFGEESESSQALAAYFTVMTEGIKFLRSLRERQRVTPYPLSGQQLTFGARPLQLSYYKSPFTERKWGASISQGEFWNGTMSRQELSNLTRANSDDYNFVVIDDGRSIEDELRVMVKVSSRPVFNSLVSPQIAFKALKMFKMRLTEEEEERSKNSRVVIAVWNPFNEGLVSIMRDISATHSDLRPGNLIVNSSVSLCDLWGHFRTFVHEQLIPLASAGVIHPDIRAGYDWTANIMAKDDGSDMLLVDFESIVSATDFVFSGSDKHGRYFDVPNGNAFSFLCLQCIVIAVAWSQQHKQVEDDRMKQPMVVVYEFENIIDLVHGTPHDVKSLLGEIGSQFEEAGFTELDEDRICKSLKQQQ